MHAHRVQWLNEIPKTPQFCLTNLLTQAGSRSNTAELNHTPTQAPGCPRRPSPALQEARRTIDCTDHPAMSIDRTTPNGTSQMAVLRACAQRSSSVVFLARLMSKALSIRSQVGPVSLSWQISRAFFSATKLIFLAVLSLMSGFIMDQMPCARNEKSTMSIKAKRSAKTDPKEPASSFNP